MQEKFETFEIFSDLYLYKKSKLLTELHFKEIRLKKLGVSEIAIMYY